MSALCPPAQFRIKVHQQSLTAMQRKTQNESGGLISINPPHANQFFINLIKSNKPLIIPPGR
jgi:hypothetical protein